MEGVASFSHSPDGMFGEVPEVNSASTFILCSLAPLSRRPLCGYTMTNDASFVFSAGVALYFLSFI